MNRRSSAIQSRRLRVLAALILSAALAQLWVSTSSARPGQGMVASPGAAPATPACGAPADGQAACAVLVNRDSSGQPLSPAAATAVGLEPFDAADLQAAYQLPSRLLGARQTIAVVVAYDHPDAESDLAAYRRANHLPACTSDSGCFRKIDQRGGESYPRPDVNWAIQASTDLDTASAVCPNCNLLLVVADEPTFVDLGTAVEQAVAQDVTVVVNSFTGADVPDAVDRLGRYYNHPGTPIVAVAGGNGFAANLPAALPKVIAVGATSLYPADNGRGWRERASSSTGSGCALTVPKPQWQKDRLCDTRTVADVAAVGDPNTPVAVYHSFGLPEPGWITTGASSASIIAGVYALAGNAGSINPGRHLYAQRRHLNDVIGGTNGHCGGSYLCVAVRGYDGPTGLGSPHGIGAF